MFNYWAVLDWRVDWRSARLRWCFLVTNVALVRMDSQITLFVITFACAVNNEHFRFVRLHFDASDNLLKWNF